MEGSENIEKPWLEHRTVGEVPRAVSLSKFCFFFGRRLVAYRTSSMFGTLGLNSSCRYVRVSWLNALASSGIRSMDLDNLRSRVT